MGAINNLRGQSVSDRLFDASGTSTGSAQLILPMAISRSSLTIQNISDTDMYLEFGAARATASLTNGAVSSISVTNVGFGYSVAPVVVFYGGSNLNRNSQPTYTLQGLPDWPAPSSPAQAHCVMTGAAGSMTVSSIVIDNPGSGYAYPPVVFLMNRHLDPFGCAAPSATSGLVLKAQGGSYTSNGSVCTTDQVALFCASSSKSFTCKYTL